MQDSQSSSPLTSCRRLDASSETIVSQQTNIATKQLKLKLKPEH